MTCKSHDLTVDGKGAGEFMHTLVFEDGGTAGPERTEVLHTTLHHHHGTAPRPYPYLVENTT